MHHILMVLLAAGVGATSHAADIADLPPEIREALRPVHLDWGPGGHEVPAPVTVGGLDTVVFGHVDVAGDTVRVVPGATGPETVTGLADLGTDLKGIVAGLDVTEQGWDVVTNTVPIPDRYFGLARQWVRDARDGKVVLTDLPIGAKLLVAANYAAVCEREQAGAVLDSIAREAYERLPAERRARLSRFANNIVRYVDHEQANYPADGPAVAYELLKPFALDAYGREHIHFWGGTIYYRLADYDAALECYSLASDLLEGAKPGSPSHNWDFESASLLGVARCYYRRERYREAIAIACRIRDDEERPHIRRVQGDNILDWIARDTDLPKGVAPDE